MEEFFKNNRGNPLGIFFALLYKETHKDTALENPGRRENRRPEENYNCGYRRQPF
jgi:hypothetical protein